MILAGDRHFGKLYYHSEGGVAGRRCACRRSLCLKIFPSGRNKMHRLFIGLIVTALLVLFCHYFVDAELALFISRRVAGNSAWARYTAAIPDLLFLLVSIITVVAVFCYLVQRR